MRLSATARGAGPAAARAPRLAAVVVSALLGWAGAACDRAPRIELSRPEARVSPAMVGVVSIFLHVTNAGSGSDALLGASVDVPGTVTEIHDVREGRMVRSERFPVPAHGSLELRPGGPHIMVFQMPGGEAGGRELTLRLRFESSGEKLTTVKIQG